MIIKRLRQSLTRWDDRYLGRVIVGGVILTSLASLGVHLATASGFWVWVGAWLMDFSTDLAGGGVLFLLIRWFLLRQRTAEAQSNGKSDAEFDYEEGVFTDITEAPPNIVQLVEQLRGADTAEGRQVLLDEFLKNGGNLCGAHLVDLDLSAINLRGVDLSNANLTKTRLKATDLSGANLRGANLLLTQLIEANLSGADLSHATLERTYISGANLQGATLHYSRIRCSLWSVNLQGADLQHANLEDAELFRTNLLAADLTHARLNNAKINRETRLPDGQYWGRKIDLMTFIDPSHPHYWRSR